LVARGTRVPRKIKCVTARRPIAMRVRYALTLSQPILLLADVKKMELMVQRREVTKAALSPTTAESIFFTVFPM
jgi:hypothetical protein